MTQREGSDSRVWVNPETGGVESTMEWQRRLNAGDPEAHRQLAELAQRQAPLAVLPKSIEALGELLKRHQAGMRIDYLYDHGWQVSISNPGGQCYVHACDGPAKWPEDGGPSLVDTIGKAIDQARREGWF